MSKYQKQDSVRKRACHNCGATVTRRGLPLTGNYCSPVCLDKARNRPDSHNSYDKFDRSRRDDYEDSRNVYNPFKDLFDE